MHLSPKLSGLGVVLALAAGCSDSRHDRGPSVDTTPPTVTATEPAAGATDVPVDTRVQATFSEAMRASSITEATFRVAAAGRPDELGVVTYDAASHVATFTPLVPWPELTTITATVTTGVCDLWGNRMAADHVWTFTTGAIPDTTPPTVVATDPADGATDVWRNRAVTATFSEPMRVETITGASFALTADGAGPVDGAVVYVGGTAVFRPAALLAADTAFTAVVRAGVQDLAGNAMTADHVWRFTTGRRPDDTPPFVVATQPPNGATDVPRNPTISATFSEAMDPATLTTETVTTFTLLGPDRLPVAGTVAYDAASWIATFTPAGLLDANTTYLARVTTGATDLASNPLAADHEWQFRTGTRIVQPPPDLGSAASFAILAGPAITNVGPSVIDGNVGVSPGGTVNGFPPGVVHGTIHAGDAVASQAKLDLTLAWLDARGRTLGVEALPRDLAGGRFTPGLWKNATAVVVGDGVPDTVVTLDAQGDPEAVFIFQVGTSLTTSPGARVVLAGGAQARNVFWQVDVTATFAAGTQWKGTVLALDALTLEAGTRVEGRMLTQVAAFTCEEVAIAVPGR